MKKYLVLKKVGNFTATVVREFDEFEIASNFGALMTESEEYGFIQYYVAQVLV